MKKLLSFFLGLVIVITSVIYPYYCALAGDYYSNSNVQHACVHDPSIVKSQEGGYYIVGSHLGMAESDDLINWQNTSSTIEIENQNYLSVNGKSWKENFAEPLEWTTKSQLANDIAEEDLQYNCWANDIIYNPTMGKYCLYGACSVWGWTASVIWLAVSDNIEGPYEYVDSLVYTGFTNETKGINKFTSKYQRNYTNTNLTDLIDAGYLTKESLEKSDYFFSDGEYNCAWGAYPNAIDPTAYTDADGNMWMVYGSYSGGCFVMPLIEETGLPDYEAMYNNADNGYDVYFGKRISTTNEENEGTGEGPFIVYDSVSKYYYFFLTYGGLGGEGGYNIREYRSENPDGPYVDAMGYDANDAKNTGLKLDGNYQFTCQPTAYLSGGHSSALLDDDGRLYQAYHTRFVSDGGNGHQIRVHQMLRTSDGWAVMLPYEYQGESVEDNGYDVSEIVGTYEFIDSTNMTQRKESGDSPFSDIVLPTQCITLNADGTITGAKDYSCSITSTNTGSKSVSGTWKVTDGSYYATFKIGSVTYSGVFCKQKEETADANEVMTFAGAGDDNSTIWGVRHTTHTYATVTTKATTSANGSINSKCSVCGTAEPNVKSKTISSIKTVKLSATSYAYTGKAITPSVVVKDAKGNTLKKNTDYTVSYPSGRKNVGTYTIKITFKGNYKGSKSLSFKIVPTATKITSLASVSKGFTVKWNKKTTQTTGYQIQYSTSSKFNSSTTKTVSSSSKNSLTVKKLKAKKTYYVRVRTYKKVGSTTYYSAWSSASKVTTKK